ncbi:MAG TPA: hypothetical protein VMU75_11310 [Acidimicrobiales bacterium]|nr:hypothetical protein [Acidimicrobiales bacterium]
MVRRSPTPVRFETDVAGRLASFAATHPGLSLSAAANLLVDEGLRVAEHPGIVFRDGPTGRRAGLAGGPDVWEIVRAVKSARESERELGEDDVLSLVVSNTGVPLPLVRTAVNYWASYPTAIDAEIDAAEDAEATAEAAWRRQRDLLAR